MKLNVTGREVTNYTAPFPVYSSISGEVKRNEDQSASTVR